MARNKELEFAVIGLGRFGVNVAQRLMEMGHSVLGIGNDPQIAKEVENRVTEIYILDATNPDALVEAGITSYSASAVTGLSVFTPSMTLTLWGQIILLVLAQIGGVSLIVTVGLSSFALGREVTCPSVWSWPARSDWIRPVRSCGS